MIVSTMLIGGVAFAAGQRVSWQVPQATVEGSGNILPRSDGGALELPYTQAPEAGKSLQPLAVQGGDRSLIGQGLLLAQDGGGGDCDFFPCPPPPPPCPKKKCR